MNEMFVWLWLLFFILPQGSMTALALVTMTVMKTRAASPTKLKTVDATHPIKNICLAVKRRVQCADVVCGYNQGQNRFEAYGTGSTQQS